MSRVHQAPAPTVNMSAAEQRAPASAAAASAAAPPRPSAEETRDRAFAETHRARATVRPRALVARPLPVTSDVPRASEPGQIVVVTRSFIPDEEFGGGFHGDGRGLSTDPDVSCRIRAGVLLEPSPGGLRGVRAGGRSDESRHDVGHLAGTLVAPGNHLLEPRTATPTIAASTRASRGGATVALDYAGSNPLTPGAPDLDVHARFQIRETEGGLEVQATVVGDAFPAAESFLRDHEGNAVFIGAHRIDIDFDVEGIASLVGDNRRPMIEARLTILRDPRTQAFTGVEVDGRRYTLEAWNARFEGVSGRR